MDVKYSADTGLPMIEGGGEWRILGALPPHPLFALPEFDFAYKVLPESEWHDCSLKQWNVPILDQGRYGSCVGHGCVSGFTYSWLISGQQAHNFSATYVYGWINGGRDNGAVVSDGMVALKTYGTCFASQVPTNMIYKRQFPKESFTTAKRFRCLEAYKINNWRELCSAIVLGLPVISGIGVGANFSKLNSNGVAPLPDRVVGGHCLLHIGLKNMNGVWMVLTQNSWGRGWGDDGFCYLQPGAWNPQFGFPFDCFAIGAVYDDPEETATDVIPLKTADKCEQPV